MHSWTFGNETTDCMKCFSIVIIIIVAVNSRKLQIGLPLSLVRTFVRIVAHLATVETLNLGQVLTVVVALIVNVAVAEFVVVCWFLFCCVVFLLNILMSIQTLEGGIFVCLLD